MTEWDAGSVVVFDLGIHPSKTARTALSAKITAVTEGHSGRSQ